MEARGITRSVCGIDAEGREICLYAFPPCGGVRLWVTNFGAAIYRLQAEGRSGEPVDVALTCDMEAFQQNEYFLGATIGRVSNRIRGGRVTLDGTTYQLSQNEGENHLHGGWKGLHQRTWDGEILGDRVVFTYRSPHGEEGYPGEVLLQVCYEVTENGAVRITQDAKTDRDTILSLTNHTYFTLGGANGKKIYAERLWVDSSFYVETDEQLLPTGQVLRTTGTPYDFQTEKALGEEIHCSFPPVVRNRGYDVTLIRNTRGYGKAAELTDEETGIRMEVYTDYPAVHLYTGNFVHQFPGQNGVCYNQHESVCLETQFCPGASTYCHLGDIRLRQQDSYHHVTAYRFFRSDQKKEGDQDEC